VGQPASSPAERAVPLKTMDGGPAAQQAEPLEPPDRPLPDDGPRSEGNPQGVDGLAWQEGQAAYAKGAWTDARRSFETVVKQYPTSPLVPSAQAFLIELALRDDASSRGRSDAIHAYKALVRNHPQSQNARRAAWRIADLYLEQGWLQEAQAAYEQTMAKSLHLPYDGNRALLGLGYTFMAMRKWSDAEHAFVTLRKRSDHDVLAQRATIALAHVLYRQRRISEAQAFYDLAYRRWTAQFRLDPLALQRFAGTLAALHHDTSARDVMVLFYNLYPRHEFAPTALLQVGDSLAAGSRPGLAEFFYALIPSLYRGTPQETIALMRLATLRADRVKQAGENTVELTVSAMMHQAPIPDQNDQAFRATLEGIAARHAGDPAGTEALFHLGRHYEKAGDMSRALMLYKDAALRSGRADDPWPLKASERLSTILKPWLEAALKSHDDLTVVTLFHRHGPIADQLYAQSPLLLDIAEAHRRLGFSLEAVRLYQQLMKTTKNPAIVEPTLVGLGRTYLDQQDPQAARKVLERYRFQFPGGPHDTDVLRLLVAALAQQRDWPALLLLCRNWLQHHPRHPERPTMYLQLAATLGRLEQYDESALAYQEALKAGATPTAEVLLTYADQLSRLDRHEQAIAAYQAALDARPTARQAEWAHLQTAKHWHALKQGDRALVALAEVGATDDPLINRYTSSLKGHVQAARRPLSEEGL
jgi:TolA-binding protein